MSDTQGPYREGDELEVPGQPGKVALSAGWADRLNAAYSRGLEQGWDQGFSVGEMDRNRRRSVLNPYRVLPGQAARGTM